jgi:hypothetical protein
MAYVLEGGRQQREIIGWDVDPLMCLLGPAYFSKGYRLELNGDTVKLTRP